MTLLFSTRHSAFSPHPCNHCDRSDTGIRTVGPLHRNYVFSRRLRPRRCAATPVMHFETVLGVRVTLLNAFLLVEIIYAGWKFNYVELFGVRTRAYARRIVRWEYERFSVCARTKYESSFTVLWWPLIAYRQHVVITQGTFQYHLRRLIVRSR